MAEKSSDKRVERSKAAVLAETYRQLTQNGMSGVSIDDIARISGVAKTTIYRHWPSRSALLIAHALGWAVRRRHPTPAACAAIHGC